MPPDPARPWTLDSGGATLAVRLTPRGGRDAIDGIETLSDGRSVLKVRVRAAPTGGEANDALIRLLARALGVPSRAVTLTAGTTARVKRLVVAGDAAQLSEALEKLAAGG